MRVLACHHVSGGLSRGSSNAPEAGLGLGAGAWEVRRLQGGGGALPLCAGGLRTLSPCVCMSGSGTPAQRRARARVMGGSGTPERSLQAGVWVGLALQWCFKCWWGPRPFKCFWEGPCPSSVQVGVGPRRPRALVGPRPT